MNPEFANPEVADNASPTLSELENDMIAFFVDTVRSFGAPKSLGAIYGLLFITAEPISFEQIAIRLRMSNGSVSQGLKILKDLGAVKVTFQPGERRDFFVAETEIYQILASFLRRRVQPQVVNSGDRIERLYRYASPLDATVDRSGHVIQARLKLLRRWNDQVCYTLPFLAEVIKRGICNDGSGGSSP